MNSLAVILTVAIMKNLSPTDDRYTEIPSRSYSESSAEPTSVVVDCGYFRIELPNTLKISYEVYHVIEMAFSANQYTDRPAPCKE